MKTFLYGKGKLPGILQPFGLNDPATKKESQLSIYSSLFNIMLNSKSRN